MDTEALWQAIAAYGNARWRGVKFEQDAADHLSEIKAIMNRSEAETRELLADNERLVDEVAELKAAYESQFKELHELKAKLTDKASLLRGCYAADHKQKQRIEELTAERDALKAENALLEEVNAQLREQNDAVGKACAKYEAELERIKALPPVAWLVLSTNQDGSISVEYVAEWPEAAHEHINDAISEHDDKEAASWVVRPVIYALGSKT